VSTIERLLKRKSSGSALENQYYGRRESAALTTQHPSLSLSANKLALTSATSGGRSVGIVRSSTTATELFNITKKPLVNIKDISKFVLIENFLQKGNHKKMMKVTKFVYVIKATTITGNVLQYD
jgi:hypothetical protein